MREECRNDLTATFVRNRIHYDPETGVITWIRREGRNAMFNKRCAGMVATSTHPRGYLRIGLNYNRYLAHRIVWVYMTGAWPHAQIDHINGDKSDNRWVNLREASISQNGANVKKLASNTSGLKGVSWHKKQRMWRATIHVCNTYIHLGFFTCPAAAHFAYVVAASNHFKEFARFA